MRGAGEGPGGEGGDRGPGWDHRVLHPSRTQATTRQVKIYFWWKKCGKRKKSNIVL